MRNWSGLAIIQYHYYIFFFHLAALVLEILSQHIRVGKIPPRSTRTKIGFWDQSSNPSSLTNYKNLPETPQNFGSKRSSKQMQNHLVYSHGQIRKIVVAMVV